MVDVARLVLDRNQADPAGALTGLRHATDRTVHNIARRTVNSGSVAAPVILRPGKLGINLIGWDTAGWPYLY
jgi:hypothetical protein